MYKFPKVDDVMSRHKRWAVVNVDNEKQAIAAVLTGCKCKTKAIDTVQGPTITRFRIVPEVGYAAKIMRLEKELAIALGLNGLRMNIENGAINIDVPKRIDTVLAGDLLGYLPKDNNLNVVIGMDMNRNVITGRINEMPHMLVAGTTGSGKSVFINCMILSLLMNKTPDDLELYLIDPKRVEFAPYENAKCCKTVFDAEEAIGLLNTLTAEMDRRTRTLAKARVKNIKEYHRQGGQMPYKVLIIDELADLMMTAKQESNAARKALENNIVRIAQKARAVGIHMVLATQYPKADVVTGLIKQNIPCKVCLQTVNATGSVVMLGMKGAEKLTGMGDLLYVKPGTEEPVRLQGGYASEKEIENVINFLAWNRKRFGGWTHKG